MTQPDLFDYPAGPAATTDDTSIAAAAAMGSRVGTLRTQVLAIVKASPVTVHECARLMNEPVPTVQPRFSELRALGLIEDGGERRTNDSGKRAIVWRTV